MNVSLEIDTRTLFISGPIEPDTALDALVGLHQLEAVDEPVTVYLNSLGGCVTSGYAIHDAIRAHPNHVTIVGTGAVKSIAAIIFQAADHRILTTNTEMLLHNGTVPTPVDGEMQADALIALARETEVENTKYATILARASGQSLARVRRWCKDEALFTARQAVKLGFADRVRRS